MGYFGRLLRALFGLADPPRPGAAASSSAARPPAPAPPRPAVHPTTQRPSRRGTAGNPDRLRTRGLPVLLDVPALAAAMERTERELWWLADPRRYQDGGRADGAATTAHYRLLLQKRGTPRQEVFHCPDPESEAGFRLEVRTVPGRPRPIMAPRMHLKAAQRWILRNILDKVDPHAAAHGFRRGRSIRSHAGQHVGRPVVLQVDLKDYFHQFTFRRVKGLFCGLGYPRPVASMLAMLCTAGWSAVRAAVRLSGGSSGDLQGLFGQDRGRWRSYHRHCMQGAPTSPALANLLTRGLDTRLAGLARRFGATYSRYADDCAFSGDAAFRRDLRRFVPWVEVLCKEEQFQLNTAKTRVARQGGRQRVTGLVVNRRLNVPRAEYRRLRAILHNCVQQGPASQNRDDHPDFRHHLLGRIAHVAAANPERGAKLRAAFDRVRW